MENDKNEKEILQWLEERLKWYTYEVSDEEFDEEEVYLISRLLQKLRKEQKDYYFNSRASIRRFQKRYGIQLKAFRRNACKKGAEASKQSKPFYRIGRIIKAAAVMVICVAGIFSMTGTIKAVKGGELEFFQIISEDDMGRSMVINGAAVDVSAQGVSGIEEFECETLGNKVYTSWEEVPGLQSEYFCIPMRGDIVLKSITATDWSDEHGQALNVCYLVGEKELWCNIEKFPNMQGIVTERYQMPFKLKDTVETEAGLTIDIRQASVGEIAGIFLTGRSSYMFSGDFTQEEFTEIMKCVKKCRFE